MFFKTTLLAAVAASLLAASSAEAAGTATITISHEMRGCHMWQLGSGKPTPNLKISIARGTTVRFVNNDIMPHKLVQVAGPKLMLTHPDMNRLAAVATVKFAHAGTYRLTTKPGEDYKTFGGQKTMGEDYVLHLTVHVK